MSLAIVIPWRVAESATDKCADGTEYSWSVQSGGFLEWFSEYKLIYKISLNKVDQPRGLVDRVSDY